MIQVVRLGKDLSFRWEFFFRTKQFETMCTFKLQSYTRSTKLFIQNFSSLTKSVIKFESLMSRGVQS